MLLMCDLWAKFPDAREMIESRTGPWFACGGIRPEWEWRSDEQIKAIADSPVQPFRRPVAEWQSSANGGEWRKVIPPHGETMEGRIAFLRGHIRANGTPMFRIRALVVQD